MSGRSKLPQLCTMLEASTILGESYNLTQKYWRERGWKPIGQIGQSLVFLADDVNQFAKVYRGLSQKPITIRNGYLTSYGAAELLRVNLDTLRNRYRLWGVPFYRRQREPRRLCFIKEELEEWALSPRGIKVLGRNQLKTPTSSAPSASS